MSSFGQQFNPRANIFILVNLGCEMIFVIDQRLQAQQICAEKSIQVIHDVTTVLLDPKFIDSLIVGSTQENAQLLTAEHCQFMLNDIATSSLMRLDESSMEKLWNLMTMMYKWQLSVAKHQHHLLDITFRHLDAVGCLHEDEKRSQLIDHTKNTMLDFWNTVGEEGQLAIFRTNRAWLRFFNTKISLLIRLGLQALDGSFIADPSESYYQEFAGSIGCNIYAKSVEIAAQRRAELAAPAASGAGRVDQLAEMLNIGQQCGRQSDELPPIDTKNVQRQFDPNMQHCNVLFDGLDVTGGRGTGAESSGAVSMISLDARLFPETRREPNGFVQLQPVYNRNSDASAATTSSGVGVGLNKELLDLYSKMN